MDIKQENRLECYGYETPYGWSEHNIVNTMGFARHYEIYIEIVAWIYANVENCEKNAMWFKVNDCIYVRLRRRQDALMFTLKWS